MRSVDVEYLRVCFEPNFATGVVYWKARPVEHFTDAPHQGMVNTKVAGKPAGRLNQNGYIVITLSCRGRYHKLFAHRVIWALKHGDWPKQVIDHINHIRTDNRIVNLRDVSPAENMRNRSNSKKLLIAA